MRTSTHRIGLVVGLMLLAGCRPAAPITPSPTALTVIDVTPTPTPPDVTAPPAEPSKPHVEISASSTALKVGDELTITGKSVGIGLEIFTIALSSGGRFVVSYDNKPGETTPDTLFDLVSIKGMNGSVEAVLRARAPGTADISISASGEVNLGGPGTMAWSWGGGGSDTLELIIGD